MKNLILLFLFISSISFAQNGINYQGAATDSQGNKLENQSISLRTSILQGGIEGSASYSETHNTTTNQFGLFNVVIGLGDVLTGSFDSIQWGADAHFLKVELDASGGSDYNLVSTTQMMSVPYAKYAENAGLDSIAIANMFSEESIFNNELKFINPIPIIYFWEEVLPTYQIDISQYINENISHIILNSEFFSTTTHQSDFMMNVWSTSNDISTPIFKVINKNSGGSNSSSGFNRVFVDKQTVVPVNNGILDINVEIQTNMTIESGVNSGEINIIGYIKEDQSVYSSNNTSFNNIQSNVSQFGDTLNINDNEYLIIPGLSVSNLHLRFNEFSSVEDSEGNMYKTLIYGDNEWMIQNLKTNIGEYYTPSQSTTSNIIDFPDSVGNYYPNSAVTDNICPTGWHIPTLEDFSDLFLEFFDTELLMGYNDITHGSILWSEDYTHGENTSYFNLFESGYFEISNDYGSQLFSSETTSFWIQDIDNNSNCNVIFNYNQMNLINVNCINSETLNFSRNIRCVKD